MRKNGPFLRGCLMAIACLILWFAGGAGAAEPPLTFGIFPYRAPQWLTTTFTPLRDYLQQASGRRVDMVSAPDYQKYLERIRSGNYDIIFTAPHFGRLAEKEHQFQRIAMTRYQIQGVILVPKASSMRQMADLRGKTLAVSPPIALTHVLALELLYRQGLQPGRDIMLREFENNQNSMAAPLRGDADAAITGILLWEKEGDHEKMRVVAETQTVPGLVLMAHPRVPKATVARLRKITEEFAGTPPGQAYFAATGHGAWLPVDDTAMKRLDPVLSRIKD